MYHNGDIALRRPSLGKPNFNCWAETCAKRKLTSPCLLSIPALTALLDSVTDP